MVKNGGHIRFLEKQFSSKVPVFQVEGTVQIEIRAPPDPGQSIPKVQMQGKIIQRFPVDSNIPDRNLPTGKWVIQGPFRGQVQYHFSLQNVLFTQAIDMVDGYGGRRKVQFKIPVQRYPAGPPDGFSGMDIDGRIIDQEAVAIQTGGKAEGIQPLKSQIDRVASYSDRSFRMPQRPPKAGNHRKISLDAGHEICQLQRCCVYVQPDHRFDQGREAAGRQDLHGTVDTGAGIPVSQNQRFQKNRSVSPTQGGLGLTQMQLADSECLGRQRCLGF